MRFLLVDRLALEELVAGRLFQSVEFEQGRTLSLLVGGKVSSAVLSATIKIVSNAGGLYMLSNIASADSVVVIDLEEAPIFGHTDSENLLVLQKVLRLATKSWKSLRFSISEKAIPNSSKALVFPFPISSQSFYRIAVDRNPDAKRRDKRPDSGKAMLVYWGGNEDRDITEDDVSLTVFRKAISELENAYAEAAKQTVASQGGGESPITSLGVTELSALPSKLDGQLGFEGWQHFLTNAQLEFINGELRAPHRIEGPAGTGKTLSLVLKCIRTLRDAQSKGQEHRSLFVAHSEATRRTIQDLFDSNDSGGYSRKDRIDSLQSLKVTTLHLLCAELLRTEISESEFLDRDAFGSKETQLLYTYEALDEVLTRDFSTHKAFLSQDLVAYFESQDRWVVAEMIRHEVSVVIKGRSQEDLEKYKKATALKYGLPIRSVGDKGFVFLVFQAYQRRLEGAGQFDTDDVVLTASAQMNTPIWRRRRDREGYDSVFIDETHYFNLNELSVFHQLTRRDTVFPIAYSADKAQALGDRGWTEDGFEMAMAPTEEARSRSEKTVIRSIFRSSPEIVNLAFSVTSSGATLFTNYQNPLELASSAFTEQDEQKSNTPTYFEIANDKKLVEDTFEHAKAMATRLGGHRAEVAIIAFSDALFAELQRFARDTNVAIEVLKRRGDIELVKNAQRYNRFVVSTPDYVAGLEFDGVLLVGVDDGRVPPKSSRESTDSANFMSYASHSRLYVAITRARFQVEILGSHERGPSPLLKSALSLGQLLFRSSG